VGALKDYFPLVPYIISAYRQCEYGEVLTHLINLIEKQIPKKEIPVAALTLQKAKDFLLMFYRC
jgi:hypothetical protein